MMQATAFILAGGKSSRMGVNKALLPIRGKRIIEVIIDELIPFFPNLFIVTNDFETYDFLKVPLIKDEFQGKGPLAGIHTGLKKSCTDFNFFVACDMPFISGKLAHHFVQICALGHYEAVVPQINDKLHPLFSVFRKKTLLKIEQYLQLDHLRVRDLLGELNVYYINEKELSNIYVGNIEKIFYNMNEPTDYEQVKSWLGIINKN